MPDLLASVRCSSTASTAATSRRASRSAAAPAAGAWHHAIDLRPADARPQNPALRALWARKWVEILEDELHMGGGKPVEDAITDLGLFYNLLTPFTSFVAIDSEVVNKTGQSATVSQPLPMPEGVSNYAVSQSQMAPMPAAAPAGRIQRLTAKSARAPMEAEALSRPEPARSRTLDDLSGSVRGAGSGAKIAKTIEAAKEEKAEGKAKDKAGCKVTVKVDKAENAGDTQALRELVEKAAQGVTCGPAAPLKLRITIDGSGKITKVEVVSGDRQLGAVLARKLTGATSATRATGADQTTVEVTITAEK